MKYRWLGSVFLLFMLIVLCLYGGRGHIAESEISVSSGQTEQAEAGYIIEDVTVQADNNRKDKLEEDTLDKEIVDNSVDKEYEYDLSEIECGQGKTVQVERLYYPQENRAEFRVTSELLNYTVKLQSRESEEFADTYILTMDVEIAQYGKDAKLQRIEWEVNIYNKDYSIYYGTEMSDIICPNFQDANRDGYLDFLVLNYFTSRERWHTIFVWDTESEEYVQVKIDGQESGRISSDPKFYDGYVEQWSIVGFYEQRFERFRWEGNELVLEDEIRMQEDAVNE